MASEIRVHGGTKVALHFAGLVSIWNRTKPEKGSNCRPRAHYSTSYLLPSSNGWDAETGLDYIQCTIKSMDSSRGWLVKGAGYGLGNQQEDNGYQT